jgi:hypothetical protein
MHVFPGMFYYFEKVEHFWKEEYITYFNDITANHSEQILLIIGAHIHFADVRAPFRPSLANETTKHPEMKSVLLICPSVSPIFLNNPGYSVLDLSPANQSLVPTIHSFKWHFLDYARFIRSNASEIDFTTIDTQKEFGIDLNDYRTIRQMD